MTKESGPGEMNRRDFLKAAAGVGAIPRQRLESGAKKEKKKIVDNSVGALVSAATLEKINFPDTFKTITPQVEQLLRAIQGYQNVFLGQNVLNKNLQNSVTQRVTVAGTEEEIHKAKQELWKELKNIEEGLGEYSEEAFYRTLVSKVPKYLADYGIYSPPAFLNFTVDDQTNNPVSFFRAEIGFHPFKIERVEHDETEQGGNKVHRDVIYAGESFSIDGKPFINKEDSRAAESSFRNIVIFENNIQPEIDLLTKGIAGLRQQVRSAPKGEIAKLKQAELERTNQWTAAAEVAITKMAERHNVIPDPEHHRKSILTHETRHLIDYASLNLINIWPYKITSDPKEHKKREQNYLPHGEINPILAQIRYSGNKNFHLLDSINATRDITSGTFGIYGLANHWIIRKMIEFISKDPDTYGVKVFEGLVSRNHQILSQMDVLLDRHDLLDSLCEKIMEYHNLHLSEDIASGLSTPQQLSETEVSRDWSKAYDIAIPAIGAGAIAWGLKKLRDRKNKVAKEKTRQQKKQDKKK